MFAWFDQPAFEAPMQDVQASRLFETLAWINGGPIGAGRSRVTIMRTPSSVTSRTSPGLATSEPACMKHCTSTFCRCGFPHRVYRSPSTASFCPQLRSYQIDIGTESPFSPSCHRAFNNSRIDHTRFTNSALPIVLGNRLDPGQVTWI